MQEVTVRDSVRGRLPSRGRHAGAGARSRRAGIDARSLCSKSPHGNRSSRSLIEVPARDRCPTSPCRGWHAEAAMGGSPGVRASCGRFRTIRPLIDGENVQNRPKRHSSTGLIARCGRFRTIAPRRTALSVANRPQDIQPAATMIMATSCGRFRTTAPRRTVPSVANRPQELQPAAVMVTMARCGRFSTPSPDRGCLSVQNRPQEMR